MKVKKVKKVNICIRNEQPSDYRCVEELARDAFWNLYFPGAHEHYVIHQMRKHPDFIAELSSVIEIDGRVEGAIFYTKAAIVQSDGTKSDCISFGPVCISQAYHRQGFGRMLITQTIELAREKGYSGIVSLGYPYHYKPYGFLSGKNYRVSMPDGRFLKGLLLLPLYDGAFKDMAGCVSLSNVFEHSIDAANNFDADFPYKEKAFQESQIEFEIACAELDD